MIKPKLIPIIYRELRYDIRYRQSKNIPASRRNGLKESGERAFDNSAGNDKKRLVQRQRVFVLQRGNPTTGPFRTYRACLSCSSIPRLFVACCSFKDIMVILFNFNKGIFLYRLPQPSFQCKIPIT